MSPPDKPHALLLCATARLMHLHNQTAVVQMPCGRERSIECLWRCSFQDHTNLAILTDETLPHRCSPLPATSAVPTGTTDGQSTATNNQQSTPCPPGEPGAARTVPAVHAAHGRPPERPGTGADAPVDAAAAAGWALPPRRRAGRRGRGGRPRPRIGRLERLRKLGPWWNR